MSSSVVSMVIHGSRQQAGCRFESQTFHSSAAKAVLFIIQNECNTLSPSPSAFQRINPSSNELLNPTIALFVNT